MGCGEEALIVVAMTSTDPVFINTRQAAASIHGWRMNKMKLTCFHAGVHCDVNLAVHWQE